MKKRLLCRLATFSTALLLSSITMIPAFAAQLSGYLDTVTADSITGWAWNAEVPEECVSVEITISSGEGPRSNIFTTTQAILPREDLKVALGSANHGFSLSVDWTKLHGETFTVTAAAISGIEKTPLIGTYSVSKDALLAAKTADSASAVTLIPEAVQKASEQASETASAAKEEIPADKISLGPGYSRIKEEAVSPSASTAPSDSKPKTVTAEPGEYLGEFKATGYCNCQRCSGGYTKTYSGTIPKANHTLSADLNNFPIGTKLVINGITYTVEDKGSSVNGKKVDIFFATHAEALAFGTQTVDVYAAK